MAEAKEIASRLHIVLRFLFEQRSKMTEEQLERFDAFMASGNRCVSSMSAHGDAGM